MPFVRDPLDDDEEPPLVPPPRRVAVRLSAVDLLTLVLVEKVGRFSAAADTGRTFDPRPVDFFEARVPGDTRVLERVALAGRLSRDTCLDREDDGLFVFASPWAVPGADDLAFMRSHPLGRLLPLVLLPLVSLPLVLLGLEAGCFRSGADVFVDAGLFGRLRWRLASRRIR